MSQGSQDGSGLRLSLNILWKRIPVPGSEAPVKELHQYFDQEVREAPAYIEELFRLSREKRMLSERWNRTYNG